MPVASRRTSPVRAFSVFARRFAVFSPGVGSDGVMRTRSGVSAVKQAHPSAMSMGFDSVASSLGFHSPPSVMFRAQAARSAIRLSVSRYRS